MTAKRKKTAGGAKRKLVLKKKTVLDLSARREARGGVKSPSLSCRNCTLAN
jgi:hypothetical protein